MKPKVVVLGEKPQGVSWLRMLIHSNLFDIIGGVPRKGTKPVWWGYDEFHLLLKENNIPIYERKDLYNLDYDIIWSLMYGFIIEPELIKKANWYGLNLHESPLPMYRGCNGYSHSILENNPYYGTTFQILGDELDSGGIIDQEIFNILPDETSKELYERTKSISELIFRRNLKKVSEKNVNSTPIDVSKEPIRNRSSLASIKKIHSSNNLRLIVRSMDFTPFEPSYYEISGIKYYMFINNSHSRLDHSNSPEVCGYLEPYDKTVKLLTISGRPIIIMPENIYKDTYPLFIPQYSWDK